MKVIITGSRGFNDFEALKQCCDYVLKGKDVSEIVSGTARGADQLGERYAKLRKIGVKKFIPDWDSLGKQAGFVRNAEMANYSDGLIAFDMGTNGTKHMIKSALKRGLWVYVHEVSQQKTPD